MNTFEEAYKAPDHTKEPDFDRVDLVTRNKIQKEVFKLMVGENPTPEIEVEWFNENAKLISYFIDHTRHTVLRGLISKGDLKGAAEEIVYLMNVSAVK